MQVLDFKDVPFNKREILRYAGVKECDESTLTLLNECLKECENSFALKVCFKIFPLERLENQLKIGNDCFISSCDLKKCLKTAKRVVIFVASVGFEIDRLIKKYNRISPAKSFMFSAIGSERVESLCDAFCAYLKEKYLCSPRFSAGYGDLPLCTQKDIFELLNVTKNLGIVLNDSYLMSPSKSVSAFVGIKDEL